MVCRSTKWLIVEIHFKARIYIKSLVGFGEKSGFDDPLPEIEM